ncbi:7121_t:CDS:2, partial [Scutellospora calospora]
QTHQIKELKKRIARLLTADATVELIFTKLHPKYHKPIKSKKKLHAHNEEHDLQLGDKVVIKSSRPYSKTKRFLVIKKEN